MNEVEQALEQIASHEVGINTELLNRVADYIESSPREFDMNYWSNVGGSSWNRLMVKVGLAQPQYTVGCVACHTVRLGGGKLSKNIPAQAQRLLGLTDEQAMRLFYVYNWPKRYREQYEASAKEPTGLAWISAQRFRHFIATNGAE